MIVSDWKSLKAICPFAGAVVAGFMESHNPATLPTGRHELSDGCYVNVDEYDTRDNRRLEAHRLYVDVQVLISGSEQILCAPLSSGVEETPYNPEKDVAFYTAADPTAIVTVDMKPGTAVLLKPWDMHAPCNAATPGHNRKLIFKIPAELVTGPTGRRIACCGDSITFGLCATSRENSYPAVLGRLLGEQVTVGNFGRNGATAIDNYDWRPDRHSPFRKAPEYAAAMLFEPTDAVVMLGMNDGNPTHCFHQPNGGPMSPAVLADYRRGLEQLISDFRALPSQSRVVLATTTGMRRVVGPQWSQAYITDFSDNVRQIREVQREVAATHGLTLIDTLTGMEDLGYYHDGCHLTDAGYAKLAEIMRNAL